MATRINTRFVLILAVIVLFAGGVVGGLWLLQVRADTSRHIRAGDALMAEGEYERALKEYGRAVSKEPSVLSHLAKVEEALLNIRPTSQSKAQEYESMRVSILHHVVRYRRSDAEAHMTLINELYRLSRWFDHKERWQELADAADDMWQYLPPSDPQRPLARLYRGLGRMRAMGFGSMGRIAVGLATQEEIDQASRDLEQFLEDMPDHDLGWASLLEAQLSLARRYRTEGQIRRADEEFAKLDQMMDDAVAAVPDGREVARVRALVLALDHMEEGGGEPNEELAAAVDRMIDLAAPSDDPNLLVDASSIVRLVDQTSGLSRAIDLIANYVEGHPGELYQRFLLANLEYLDRDYEAAYEDAAIVKDTEPLPVSALAQIQQTLRLRAASLIIDIEFRRWEAAEDDEERAAALARVVEARDRLAALVAEPENEPLLIKADGKIATTREDYPVAAAAFERVIRIGQGVDFETLWYAARALEQIGQRGLARERLAMAVELAPNNAVVQAEKGRLEYRMGLLEEARASVEKALAIDPENDLALRLVTAIDANLEEAEREATDPVAKAVLAAEQAIVDNNLEQARTALLEVLDDAADQLPLLTQLVQVEVKAGRTEAAQEYLARARALQPDNQFLRKLELSLSNQDQIEALKQYIAEQYPEEADRVAHTLVNLRVLAREMERIAREHEDRGEDEMAAKTRDRIAVANAEADQLLDRAQQIAPAHPVLLDYLFNEALEAEDWTALEALVATTREIDADQAGGLIYKGRYEMARGNYAQAVVTLTEATDRKHWSSMAWRLLGRSHEYLGNFTEALEAYAQAHTCNPNDRFAVRWYVNLLMQTGERTRALRVLRSARHALPRDGLLQEARLQLEAEVGDFAAAIDERRRIYDRNPDDQLNALRLAALLSRSQPTFAHIHDKQGNPKYDGDQWKLLPESERVKELDKVRDSWQAEARSILDAVEETGEQTADLAALRAELLKARGHLFEGLDVLDAYVRDNPQDIRGYLALGAYQAANEQIDDAVATYGKARAYQSEDIREADRALADLHFSRSNWRLALDLYKTLATEGGDRSLALRLIECQIKMQQYDAAQAALEEVVATSGEDYFAAMLAAGIAQGLADRAHAEGSTDAAALQEAAVEAALARAQDLMPSNPLPYVRRAQQIVGEYRRSGNTLLLDDALMVLEQADRVAAGAEATSRVRVEILREKGDLRAAVGELTRLLERSPQNVEARTALLQLLVEEDNLNTALDIVDDAIALSPSVALWYEAKGDLHVLRGENDLARPLVLKAYELQPNKTRLSKYAELALGGNAPDYKSVAELIEAASFQVEGAPLLRGLYARALAGLGRFDVALDQMRRAYAEHAELMAMQPAARAGKLGWLQTLQQVIPDNDPREYERIVRELSGQQPSPLELVFIARTWVNYRPGEGLGRAIDLLSTAYAQVPEDDRGMLAQIGIDLGQFYVIQGEHQKAVETFEQVLEFDPDNALALNNSAYLYAEELGAPNKAVPYAEHAAAVQPDDPFILDTLGWALYRSQRHEDAETALRKSIDLRPLAENHLHLAYVFDATGRYDNALKYLRRAGELRPSPDVQAEIDDLTQQVNRNKRRTP